MVASDDLSGLGSARGAAVTIHWSPWITLAAGAKYLLILALLFLGPNRRLAAWWIWIPLLLIQGSTGFLAAAPDPIPPESMDLLGQTFEGIALGMSVALLLSPYSAEKPRPIIFLGMLRSWGLAVVAQAAAGGIQGEGLEMAPALIAVAFLGLHAALSFSLAAWSSRRGFSGSRFAGHLILWMVLVSFIFSLPFMAIGFAVGGFEASIFGMTFGLMLLGALASLLVQAPFYILSALEPLFRERFHDLRGLPPFEIRSIPADRWELIPGGHGSRSAESLPAPPIE